MPIVNLGGVHIPHGHKGRVFGILIPTGWNQLSREGKHMRTNFSLRGRIYSLSVIIEEGMMCNRA